MLQVDLLNTRLLIEAHFKHNKSMIKNVLLLSPNSVQVKMFDHFFPDARINCAGRWQWDLNHSKDWYFDLVFAGNVFMYASRPELWFINVMRSCRYFLLQDVIHRRRGLSGEFGDDGDKSRYCFSARGVHSQLEGALDLSSYEEQTIQFRTYQAGPYATHFVMLLTGGPTDVFAMGESPVLRFGSYAYRLRLLLRDA